MKWQFFTQYTSPLIKNGFQSQNYVQFPCVQRSLWFHNFLFVLVFFWNQGRKIHCNFIALWSLKWFEKDGLFIHRLFECKIKVRKFQEGISKLQRSQGEANMRMNVWLLYYFCRDGKLFMFKPKRVSVYIQGQFQTNYAEVFSLIFFLKCLTPGYYL